MPNITIMGLHPGDLDLVFGSAKVRVIFSATKQEPQTTRKDTQAESSQPSTDGGGVTAGTSSTGKGPIKYRPPPYLSFSAPVEGKGLIIPIFSVLFVPEATPDQIPDIITAYERYCEAHPSQPKPDLVIDLRTATVVLADLTNQLASLGDINVTLQIVPPCE